ncbi:tRNA lysidine(34) synthetase TilS [Campylobacter sp. MG1]|uniref:tRNA lysidine(34) synthetase TilS n=1 Tax=Campylobacter sp. MG1 TaxID=2976332 RepID=UPI00226CB655|nr:tRNA lysidine(34) synthetase TilS [Campylobacter sp. MG1]
MRIEYLEELKGKKNLLAFSHGTDSTALFYALLNNCEFDLCLVNYHTRINSNKEEEKARNLANKYGKNIYIKHASLAQNNFENNARNFRYEFFDELMCNYDNLIIAHNLNDRFEWFLMQFAKGAGLCNLLGFNGIDNRKNYKIIRPLINVSKDEIMLYLNENNYEYFQDESNFNTKYKRNEIRLNYANEFIKSYSNGIKKSFSYLENDKFDFLGTTKEYKNLLITKNINSIDKAIKKLGFISSAKQKSELQNLLKENNESELFFGKNSVCVCVYLDTFFVFLKTNCKLNKNEKELYRKEKVPNKLRFFLSKNQISISEIKNIINKF